VQCGTLQSPSDRKFKSEDAEFWSVPTRDTYRKTGKPQGTVTLSNDALLYLNWSISAFRKVKSALWCGPYKAPQIEGSSLRML
jgi:hypothetical protein